MPLNFVFAVDEARKGKTIHDFLPVKEACRINFKSR
jgi:hypothetical protein